MIEVHHQPEEALSDGNQSIQPPEFSQLMDEIRQIAGVLGRTVAPGCDTPVQDDPLAGMGSPLMRMEFS